MRAFFSRLRFKHAPAAPRPRTIMAAAGLGAACTVNLTRVKHEQRPEHHLNDSQSLFHNPWPSFMAEQQGSLSAVWRMQREMDRKPLPPPHELVPVVKPDWGVNAASGKDEAYRNDIKATWLGHACFLVEFPIPQGQSSERGYRLLFDPVFSHRCSPSQWVGPARYTPPPIPMKEIPEIDGVVISHAHYDHMDVNTLNHLYKAQKDGSLHFFVPLGNKKWFESTIGVTPSHVSEFDWWDSAMLSVPSQSGAQLRLTCTPCQHFANRGLFDRNHTLWASWAVEQLPLGPDAAVSQPLCKLWFGGDTAYKGVKKGMTSEEEAKLPHCPAFKQIGETFEYFDMAMVPIGAYSPRWFMSQIHASPEDAVEIHTDIRSRKSVGMHWATWVLTDEEVNEPKIRLAAAVKAKAGLKDEDFITLESIGGTLRVTPNKGA